MIETHEIRAAVIKQKGNAKKPDGIERE